MSEAIRWCGVTLAMNAPYLDPDDVAAARARLALTDDDLAVLARVRLCAARPFYGAGIELLDYLLTGEPQ